MNLLFFERFHLIDNHGRFEIVKNCERILVKTLDSSVIYSIID